MDDSQRDWHLIARARAGDMRAFAELVQRYQSPIIHFCQRMVGSLQDAEDLAQETFVRVFRHLPRLTEKAKFSTLLFGIARNLALNAIRDTQRRANRTTVSVPPDFLADTPGPDGHARVREMEGIIERAMGLLSSDHREVLVLREVSGMDYDEIANVINCRTGTVKSRLARAREQLRVLVTDLSGGQL